MRFQNLVYQRNLLKSVDCTCILEQSCWLDSRKDHPLFVMDYHHHRANNHIYRDWAASLVLGKIA